MAKKAEIHITSCEYCPYCVRAFYEDNRHETGGRFRCQKIGADLSPFVSSKIDPRCPLPDWPDEQDEKEKTK